ncbi:hypothetical protein Tco_0150472 [Tanacetum coccineum]
MECSHCTLGPKELKVECPFKTGSQSKAKSFEGCRSSVRMTMHEVVHEMVFAISHSMEARESNGLIQMVDDSRCTLDLKSLERYPNGKGVVCATSRGIDMALHWSGVGAAPLMSPRQDETSEPLLYAGWMAGPYQRISLDDDDVIDVSSLDSRSFQEGKAMD